MGAMGGGLSLGTLSITIAAAVDQALQDFQKFGSEVGQMIDEQKSKWEGLKTAGESLSSVGTSLTVAITAPLLGVGAAAVTVSEQLNQARVGFTTMLGSGDAAAKMLGDLQKFAATTPFEFPDLVKSAQRMMALGFTAEQVIPTLRTIGDTAAGMGQGKEAIDGITLALGQMQSKGKVSAQEMNQLAERGIPAWKILAEAIGVSIPEAMKLAEKGAIQASQAVPALLAGMNEKFAGNMDQMSKTLTGQWSNFKDTISQALIPIGEALTPALTGLVQLLVPVIEGIKEMATWFGQLPAPVQAFALTIVALAAALGPVLLIAGQLAIAIGALMPAITAAAGVIGVSVVALGGWVIAIAAVVAGLVALGVWVHQNWNAIMAVIQDALAVVVQKISDFIGWLAKLVPASSSVGKALNDAAKELHDYGEQAKGSAEANRILQKATDDQTAATKKAKDEAKAAKPSITVLADAQKEAAKQAAALAKETKDCAAEFKPLIEKNDVLYAIAGKLSAAHQKLAQDIAAAKLSGHDITKEFGDGMAPALEKVNTETGLLVGHFDGLTGTNGLPKVLEKLGQVKLAMDPATGSIASMNSGLETLGITSAAKFAQIAADAQTAYDKVIAAPDATKWEKDSAFLKLLEAQRQKMIANGEEIPALMTQQMSDIKASIDGKAPAVTGAFDGFATSVSTVITNFAQDISKSLWDGDLSWKEKGKEALKGLGQAVTSSFIEPATKAIGDFIGGAIKDLLSGDGLGGILSSLKDIGSGFGSIFKGGAAASTPAAGSVPSTGGAGSVASGAMSSALGWATLGVSVASAVVDFFQGSETNKTLDTIGKHTLQTANDLANLRRDDWDRHAEYAKWKDDILPALWGIQGNTGTAIASLQAIETHCYNASAALADMLGDSRTSGPAAASFMEDVVNLLGKMSYKLDAIAAGGGMTMQLYGTDPTTVASKIATQMRLQGGRA